MTDCFRLAFERQKSAFLLASLSLALACGDETTTPAAGGGSGPAAGSAGAAAAGAGGTGVGGAGSGGSATGGTAGALGGTAGGGAIGGAGTGAGGGAGAAGSGASGEAGGGTGGVGGAGQAGGAGSTAGGASGAGGSMSGASGAGGAASGASGMAGGGVGGAGGSGGATYQPCPANGPCIIMPFGDSITEGYPVNGGYRSELFKLTRAQGHEITFVGSANNNSPTTVDGVTFPRNHEGHGGYTIEGGNGIAQFVNTSIPNYDPHIITLMIGTNDINGNINVSDAPNRLGRLLDSIFTADPDILVILAQIIPTRTDGTNNTVRTYNAAFPNLVASRVAMGRHLVLLDMYGAFTSNADYKTALLGDNLHPNQAGYTFMAETWYDALEPYLR